MDNDKQGKAGNAPRAPATMTTTTTMKGTTTMKRSVIAGSKVKPTHMWKAFFARLLENKNSTSHPTETYVGNFSESFHLAKAEYKLRDRTVIL